MDAAVHMLNNAVDADEETPSDRLDAALSVTTDLAPSAEEPCLVTKEESHAYNNLSRTNSGSRLMRHARSLSGNEVAQTGEMLGSRGLEKLRSELHESRRALEVSKEEAHLAARIGQTLLHRNQQMDRELEFQSMELHEHAAVAERQIARLEQKLQDAAARIRALDLKNAELVHEKEVLSQEAQHFRHSNALVKQELKKLQDYAENHALSAIDTTKLQTELDGIRQTKDRLLVEKAQLRERVHEMEHLDASHLKTIERLKTELRVCSTEKQQLKKQVFSLQQAQSTLQQDHMSQAIQLHDTTSRLEVFEETKELLAREVLELRELLEAESQKSQELERRRDELEAILLILDLKDNEKGSMGSVKAQSFPLVALASHLQDHQQLLAAEPKRRLSHELPPSCFSENLDRVSTLLSTPTGNQALLQSGSTRVRGHQAFPSSFLIKRIGSDADTLDEEDLKRIDQLSGHELMEALDLPSKRSSSFSKRGAIRGGGSHYLTPKCDATQRDEHNEGLESGFPGAEAPHHDSSMIVGNTLGVEHHISTIGLTPTTDHPASAFNLSVEEDLKRIDQLSSRALLEALDLPCLQSLSARAMMARTQRRRRSVSLKEVQLHQGSLVEDSITGGSACASERDRSTVKSPSAATRRVCSRQPHDTAATESNQHQLQQANGSSQDLHSRTARSGPQEKKSFCRFCSHKLDDLNRVHCAAASTTPTTIEIDPLEEFFLLTAAAVKANGFGLDNDRCNIPNEDLHTEAMQKGLAYDRFHSWLCWRLSAGAADQEPIGNQSLEA